MNSFSIQASGIGACAIGSAMSVNLTMTREQQRAAIVAILGSFTKDAVVRMLVEEFGELVEAKE